MYFKFPCTNCGKNLKVSDEHIGRKATCPYCHTKVAVPEPPKAEQPKPTYTSPNAPALDDADQPEAVEKKSGKPAEAPQEKTSGTDVRLMLSAPLGLLFFAIIYGALFPLPQDTLIRQFFYERTWVNFITVFFACWTAAIVVLKQLKVKRQREAMLFDLLPTDIADEITPSNVSKFSQHVRELPTGRQQLFLVTRVLRGLEHFQVRRNAAEVGSVMQSQSDIDNNEVASSYTILNQFLWAIPILGFIGTVMGISLAVGEFGRSMGAGAEAPPAAVAAADPAAEGDAAEGEAPAADADAEAAPPAGGTGSVEDLKNSLGGVIAGLATAFDTTLIALIASIILIFPVKTTLKSEEDLLNWVDEYCNENLLKRLKDGSASGGSSENVKEIHKAINAAMADHHAELITWTDKLEKIGEAISRQAARGWTDVHKEVGEEMAQVERKFNDALQSFMDKQRESIAAGDEKYQSVVSTQRELIEGLGGASEKLSRTQQDIVEEQSKKAREWIENLGSATEKLGRTQQDLIDEQAKKVRELVDHLEQAEQRLADKQQHLSEEQAEKVGQIVNRIDSAGEKLAEVQKALADQVADARNQDNAAQREAADALKQAAESITKYVGGMDDALGKLNKTLADLGEKQVVIQQQAPQKKKRGWFG